MKDLLGKHLKKYPYMEIQDLVKLIYQNEFAGGHLIIDKNSSLERLIKEQETLDEVSSLDVDLFEDIGGGLCRLYLYPLKKTSLSLETLHQFFILTASENKGTLLSFEDKLKKLLEYAKTQEIPFSYEEVKAYLDHYKTQGYPAVSHSDTFRTHYKPAYRVVKKVFADYFKLFCRLDALNKTKDTTINAAIDGKSGSGKSTLAALLSLVYDCNVFHMDDFFLRPEQRTEERKKEIGGNVDYERFKSEIADHLNTGEPFSYQIYDCSKGKLTDRVIVQPKKINIVEGVYSLHPLFKNVYKLKIFLTIDEKTQSMRILKRSGPRLHQRFVTEWIPLENAYFNAAEIETMADIVIKSS